MKKLFSCIMMICFVLFSGVVLASCGDVNVKVNFYVDGELHSSISISPEEEIPFPQIEEKQDFYLDGWYVDAQCTAKFDPTTLSETPQQTLDLYARWKAGEVQTDLSIISSGSVSILSDGSLFARRRNEADVIDLASCQEWFDLYSTSSISFFADEELTQAVSGVKNLGVGDNFVWIKVSAQDQSFKSYKLNLYRNHMYKVEFKLSDKFYPEMISSVGHYVEYVEEGYCLQNPQNMPEIPVGIEVGYKEETNGEWDFDINAPVMKDMLIDAKLIPQNRRYYFWFNGSAVETKYVRYGEEIALYRENPEGKTISKWICTLEPCEQGMEEKVIEIENGQSLNWAQYDKYVPYSVYAQLTNNIYSLTVNLNETQEGFAENLTIPVLTDFVYGQENDYCYSESFWFLKRFEAPKEGYHAYWTENGSVSQFTSKSAMPARDVELTLKIEPNQTLFKFDKADSDKKFDNKTVKYNQTESVPVFEKAGMMVAYYKIEIEGKEDVICLPTLSDLSKLAFDDGTVCQLYPVWMSEKFVVDDSGETTILTFENIEDEALTNVVVPYYAGGKQVSKVVVKNCPYLETIKIDHKDDENLKYGLVVENCPNLKQVDSEQEGVVCLDNIENEVSVVGCDQLEKGVFNVMSKEVLDGMRTQGYKFWKPIELAPSIIDYEIVEDCIMRKLENGNYALEKYLKEPTSKKTEELFISDKVEIISTAAFAYYGTSVGCKLRVLFKPTNSLKVIEAKAFEKSNLSWINFSQNGNVEVIGEKAFADTLITAIYLQSSIDDLALDCVSNINGIEVSAYFTGSRTILDGRVYSYSNKGLPTAFYIHKVHFTNGDPTVFGEMDTIYFEGAKAVECQFTKYGHVFSSWANVADNSYVGSSELDPGYYYEMTVKPVMKIGKFGVHINYISSNSDGVVDGKPSIVLRRYTSANAYDEHSGVQVDVTYDYLTKVKLKAVGCVGYKFNGWYDAEGKLLSTQEEWAEFTIGGETLEVYLKFDPIVYYIDFLAGEAEAGEMERQVVYYGEPTKLSANKFTKEHHYFSGWDTNINGTPYGFVDEGTIDSLTSVEGKVIELVATFMLNRQAITVMSENPVVFKEVYTSDHYGPYTGKETAYLPYGSEYTIYAYTGGRADFIGWYVNDELVSNKNIYTTVVGEEDVAYIAKFRGYDFTFRFDANGGEGEMEDQHFVYGTPQNINKLAFTKEHYYFGGWSVNHLGFYYEDEEIIDHTRFYKHNWTKFEDGQVFTLYAAWGINTPLIEIIPNDYFRGQVYVDTYGNGDDGMMKHLEYGTVVTAHVETPWTNYKFVGWYIGDELYSSEREITYVVGDYPETIIARFEKKEFTIKYNANGGQGTMEDQIVFIGEATKTISKCAFINYGQKFVGWLYNGEIIADEAELVGTFVDGQIVELVAQWEFIYTNASVSSEDEEMGTIIEFNGSYKFGTVLNLQATAFEGHHFLGWFDGEGDLVYEDEQLDVVVEGDPVILIARFDKNAFTVIFDIGDADGQFENINCIYGDTIEISTQIPIKQYHDFSMWQYNGSYYQPGDKLEGIVADHGEEIVFVAQFRRRTVELSIVEVEYSLIDDLGYGYVKTLAWNKYTYTNRYTVDEGSVVDLADICPYYDEFFECWSTSETEDGAFSRNHKEYYDIETSDVCIYLISRTAYITIDFVENENPDARTERYYVVLDERDGTSVLPANLFVTDHSYVSAWNVEELGINVEGLFIDVENFEHEGVYTFVGTERSELGYGIKYVVYRGSRVSTKFSGFCVSSGTVTLDDGQYNYATSWTVYGHEDVVFEIGEVVDAEYLASFATKENNYMITLVCDLRT